MKLKDIEWSFKVMDVGNGLLVEYQPRTASPNKPHSPHITGYPYPPEPVVKVFQYDGLDRETALKEVVTELMSLYADKRNFNG